MKLKKIRISNFQSFGPDPTEISFSDSTFLIGPNGSGKTAVLQALCRMFAVDQRYRGIEVRDFHRSIDAVEMVEPEYLWIEAEFELTEAEETDFDDTAGIPPSYRHMRLVNATGNPLLRVRLEATLHPDEEIEESLLYVTNAGEDGTPPESYQVPRTDRHYIQMHYLPARRDPLDHVAFTTSALLGRFLRAVHWQGEKAALDELNSNIQIALSGNPAIESLTDTIRDSWNKLHKGSFFNEPSIGFGNTDLQKILRLLTLAFSPSHHEQQVEFSRLSDGQKSLLYLSIVLASHSITKGIIAGENTSFDSAKLKTPVHTIIGMEEPENSLSPHYLGRVVSSLAAFGEDSNAQSLITTHSPSILKRVEPEAIRHLRLDEDRRSVVSEILLPPETISSAKYIREAVQAFPEIFFSRLVILGEGLSEQILLHRMLKASDLGADDASISVAPLGGRHVNHFWRLLSQLGIPYVTLLDFDLGRFGGGWGRIKYAYTQLKEVGVDISDNDIADLENWNSDSVEWEEYFSWLEANGVFFSYPLDVDFSMLKNFEKAYEVTASDKRVPAPATIQAVLGRRGIESLHSDDDKKLFGAYQKLFKLNSKPASHLVAMSASDDNALLDNLPEVFSRLIEVVRLKLAELPE